MHKAVGNGQAPIPPANALPSVLLDADDHRASRKTSSPSSGCPLARRSTSPAPRFRELFMRSLALCATAACLFVEPRSLQRASLNCCIARACRGVPHNIRVNSAVKQKPSWVSICVACFLFRPPSLLCNSRKCSRIGQATRSAFLWARKTKMATELHPSPVSGAQGASERLAPPSSCPPHLASRRPGFPGSPPPAVQRKQSGAALHRPSE